MDSSSPTKETEQCTEYRDLRFLTLLNEALRIPFRNIHFTGFILITSLPLLLFMMFFQTLLESSVQDFLNLERPLMRPSDRYIPFYQFYAGMENLTKVFSEKIIFLSLIYLVPLPIFEFLAAYLTIYLASKVHKNDPMLNNTNRNLKQRLHHMNGFFVTSLIVHVLSTTLFLGFIWLSIFLYGCDFVESFYDITVIVVCLAGLATATLKYLEMKAVLNSSMVVSVLGDIHGIDALVVSMRLSKGKEKVGCYLMMVFFVWEFVLRFSCIFFDDGNVGIIGRTTLLWFGSLMKWVVCVVYCYTCMGKVLEQKMARNDDGSRGGEDVESPLAVTLLKDSL